MAHILVDRVKETTTTTGTGTVALVGAVTGFRAFSAVMANNDTTLYAIVGQTPGQWEVGLGTWLTGNSLARTTPIAGSAATPVNFSAGTKDVFQTFTPTGRVTGMTYTGALTPAMNDAAALGSASLSWADLFLADAGVINWANGAVTLTGLSPDQLSVNGGVLATAAGTTSYPGLALVPGTLQTTPAVGSIEADTTNIYGTTDLGNRGVIPIVHYIRANVNRTYTSDTNSQAIFNAPTNGRITLETGVYEFTGSFLWTTMSATSGNRTISLIGAGTATVTSYVWHAVGLDGANGTVGAAGYLYTSSSVSPASVTTATVNTTLGVQIRGSFNVTVAGTMIPSTTMVTASASVLALGSFYRLQRIGSTSMVSVGQWD